MLANFFKEFSLFFNKQGELLLYSFYLHIVINFFIIRFHQDKFNKRFFEKFISACFFLISINLILFPIYYYLPYLIYFLLFLTTIISLIEINLYFEYKIFLTSDIFILLFETNNNETKEFIDGILSFKLLKNIIFSIGMYILFPFLLTKFSYKIFNNILNNLKFNSSIQYVILFFLIFSFLYFLQAQKKKKRVRYYSFLILFRVFREYLSARKLNKKNLEALKLQKNIEEKISNLNFKNKEIDNLIFIIGKSASRNYIEIYNPNTLKNSPNMLKEEKEGNLFAFDNIISQNSITSLVVPSLFTFKNYENEKEWYDYKNMISILKKAGYTTYWLSNQGKSETIAKVFSSLSDKKFFSEDFIDELSKKEKEEKLNEIFSKENGEIIAYDEILFKEAFKILGNEKKKAIFIHLQGSHSDYKKRYPAKWEIDTKDMIQRNLSDRRKKYIAEYSNTLRYTDYVLEEIFSYFSDEKSFFIYFSDHAEEIWENRDLRGHTSINGSKYMIEIPFFIMMSKKLQEIYPDLVEACKKNIHKPYMTDDIIHTVLGVLGIEIDEYDEKRNLLSDNFNEKRKRIYQGKDYDTFWRTQFDKK